MTRQEAEEQAAKFRELSGLLNDSLRRLMMTGPSGPQFNEYRRVVGIAMGAVFLSVLNPIWRRYPDLEPPEMQAASPKDPPIDRQWAESISPLLQRLEEAVSNYSKLVDGEGDPYYARALEAGVPDFDMALQQAREFIGKSKMD